MTALSASEIDFEAMITKDEDASAESEYIFADNLKVTLWGTTYAFPGNYDKDPKWTVDALKERTFDEFRQKLIDFFIEKSIERAKNNPKSKYKDDDNIETNIEVIGNLVIGDISFKLHGDPVDEKSKKGKVYTFGETKYIGDVLYLTINDKNAREDCQLPLWVRYLIKNEKKIRKQKMKEWNAKAAEYAAKSGSQISTKEDLAHLKETGDWTMKLILDNAYKEEIDILNAKNGYGNDNSNDKDSGSNDKDSNNDSSKDAGATAAAAVAAEAAKIEYIVLSDSKEEVSEIELTVDSAITVGALRERVYNEIMGIEKNRKNMFLANINFKKELVTLKHKFSYWVDHSNATEMRHAGSIKNGGTIKIGIKIPLWYKVLQKLDEVNNNLLKDDEPKPKEAKKEINNIMQMIREENRH